MLWGEVLIWKPLPAPLPWPHALPGGRCSKHSAWQSEALWTPSGQQTRRNPEEVSIQTLKIPAGRRRELCILRSPRTSPTVSSPLGKAAVLRAEGPLSSVAPGPLCTAPCLEFHPGSSRGLQQTKGKAQMKGRERGACCQRHTEHGAGGAFVYCGSWPHVGWPPGTRRGPAGLRPVVRTLPCRAPGDCRQRCPLGRATEPRGVLSNVTGTRL